MSSKDKYKSQEQSLITVQIQNAVMFVSNIISFEKCTAINFNVAFT